MQFNILIGFCVSWVLFTQEILCGELTFELPDNQRMCFHEVIEQGVQSNLDYQVVIGGNYDVDLEVTAPNGRVVYKETKKQYDTVTWTAETKGVYTLCFSNEFSTFTHKVVYFDLEVGEDKPVVEEQGGQATAMTLMEMTSSNIHGSLVKATSLQNFFRNMEAGGRVFADNLNQHVMMWSIGETVAVLVVGLGQVLVLRSFFSGPSPRSTANGRIST